MKQSERFNRAYTALVNAYHNGTLAKGHCSACAVGNMVASSHRLMVPNPLELTYQTSILTKDDLDISDWKFLFETHNGYQSLSLGDTYNQEKGRLVIKETGYSVEELAKIEFAFEISTRISWRDYYISTEQQILEDQFNGLSAVLDVLLELDSITDEKNKLRSDLAAHPSLEKVI